MNQRFQDHLIEFFLNKAGYTAISCGWAGRGGNTRFPTFQLKRERQTNQPTNWPTNQPTDGWMDKASYRVACPPLKKKIPNL